MTVTLSQPIKQLLQSPSGSAVFDGKSFPVRSGSAMSLSQVVTFCAYRLSVLLDMPPPAYSSLDWNFGVKGGTPGWHKPRKGLQALLWTFR